MPRARKPKPKHLPGQPQRPLERERPVGLLIFKIGRHFLGRPNHLGVRPIQVIGYALRRLFLWNERVQFCRVRMNDRYLVDILLSFNLATHHPTHNYPCCSGGRFA